MIRALLVAVAGWLGFVGVAFSADATCYKAIVQGQPNVNGPTYTQAAQAYATIQTRAVTTNTRGQTVTVQSCTIAGRPTAADGAVSCSLQTVIMPRASEPNYCNTNQCTSTSTLPMSKTQGTCPADACAQYQGQQFKAVKQFPSGFGGSDVSEAMTASGQYCKGSSTKATCGPMGSNGQTCAIEYNFGGGESYPEEIVNPSQKGNCFTGSGGLTCASTSGNDDCMVVGGERLCFEAPEDLPADNECWTTAGGGVLCAESAPHQPAIQGQQPKPDAVINKGGDTYNYYGNSTVDNSNQTTVTGGSVSGGAANGNGQGTGTGNGSGEEGDPFKLCEGTAACVGQLGQLDGIQSSVSSFVGAVQGAPIVAAATSIGTNIPGSACQFPTFAAFGQTLSMQAMCTTIEPVVGIISAVMMFVWGVFAFRVFMSA